MQSFLKENKSLYHQIILAVLPVTVAASTADSALLAALTALLCAVFSGATVTALKNFLSEKTAPFVMVILSAGVIGIVCLITEIFAPSQLAVLGFTLQLLAIAAPLTVSSDFCLNQSLPVSVLTAAELGGVQAAFILASGILRELLGYGSLFGLNIYGRFFSPAEFFSTPAGGLMVSAVFLIIYGLLVRSKSGEGETK